MATMADFVIESLPRKPMTSEILDETEANKSLMKRTAGKGVHKTGHGSMSRPCRLFVKVDLDGLLVENCTISDIVNFDCYESIHSSAHELVAHFMSEPLNNIEIIGLFYYKKRARSTRMNPVKIKNTTDGFRAVAEHPSGEVPLGVRWLLKRNSQFLIPSEDIEKRKMPTPGIEPYYSPDSEEDNPVAAEKRRRKNEATTKLYFKMKDVSDKNSPEPKEKNPVRVRVIRAQLPAPKKDRIRIRKKKKEPQVYSSDNNTPPPPTEDKSAKSSFYQATYLWPSDVTTEVVFTYGGLVERHKLDPALTSLVQGLTKGDFSCIKGDTLSMLKLPGATCFQGVAKYHTLPQPSNLRLPLTEPNVDKKPITSLKTAKSEIFKILSMLNLSQSRFKELLKWMKSLQLEDSHTGQFFLSERNIVGGPNAQFHSNQESARRATQKERAALVKKAPIILHPVNPHLDIAEQLQETAPQNLPTSSSGLPMVAPGLPSMPGVPAPGQYILVMQQDGKYSTVPGGGGTAPTFVSMSSQGVPMVTKAIPVPVVTTCGTSSVPATAMCSNGSVFSKWKLDRPYTPKHRLTEDSADDKDSPVPMKLFQLYGEGNKELPLLGDFSGKEGDVVVKQEPNDEQSDTNDDLKNPDSLEQGIYTDNPEQYSYSEDSVLKQDASLPSSGQVEPDYEKVVVKSEPMDDYE